MSASTRTAEHSGCAFFPTLTPPQKCALAASVASVVLLTLSAFAIAGINSPACAFGSFGESIGETSAYLMLGAGCTLALVALVLTIVKRSAPTTHSKPQLPADSEKNEADTTPSQVSILADSPLDKPEKPVNILSDTELREVFDLATELGRGEAVMSAVGNQNGGLLAQILAKGSITEETRGAAVIETVRNGNCDMQCALLNHGDISEEVRGQAINLALDRALGDIQSGHSSHSKIDRKWCVIVAALAKKSISAADLETIQKKAQGAGALPLLLAEIQKIRAE